MMVADKCLIGPIGPNRLNRPVGHLSILTVRTIKTLGPL